MDSLGVGQGLGESCRVSEGGVGGDREREGEDETR